MSECDVLDKNEINTKSSSQNKLMNILLPSVFSQDMALQSFENRDNSYLLARTLRSGDLYGVETEFAYLENAPGYIFINPTTLISKKFPSKTLSQLPSTDWSDHSTLLFSVQTQKKSTIAHYGLFSLNSFSSSDALSLMKRLARIENRTHEKLTFSSKIRELAVFLQTNWKNTIHSVNEDISLKEGKKVELPSLQKLKKKFYKPFELFFHDKAVYSSLIFSFEHFVELLEQSNKLDHPTLNVPLNPHSLATLMENYWIQSGVKSRPEHQFRMSLYEELQTEFRKVDAHANLEKKSQIEKDRVFKLKGLFFRAEGNLKKSLRKAIDNEDLDGKSIYERYCDYLDAGARHNEVTSRVYPWEITGVEWGGTDACKINSIANALIAMKHKKNLYQEIETQNVEHPLFVDFMMNKFSIENPRLNNDEITELFHVGKIVHRSYFLEIIEEIKLQCLNPVCIYEYSSTSRELINISALLAGTQQAPFVINSYILNKIAENGSSWDIEYRKIEQCRALFEAGINTYQESLDTTTIIAPVSKIKKLNFRIKTPELMGWFKFWEKNTAAQEMVEILQYLADNIINQPYVDEKREQSDSSGYTIYRPNHDVTHATRKLSYKQFFCKLILESESEPWGSALKCFTQEEIACMNLLIFLYRSGRTNELGSSVDPSNSERSANVFELIARQLGFNAGLVRSMKNCLNFLPLDAPIEAYLPEGYSGNAVLKAQKAYLVHRIASICHDMDLVRCNSWRHYFINEEEYLLAKQANPSIKNFKFDIMKQIKVFFPDEQAELIADDLFLLAKKSCEASGTPVFYDGFSSSEKVSDYKELIKDPTLIKLVHDTFGINRSLVDIKGYWTKNVAECFMLLQNVTYAVEEELCSQKERIMALR